MCTKHAKLIHETYVTRLPPFLLLSLWGHGAVSWETTTMLVIYDKIIKKRILCKNLLMYYLLKEHHLQPHIHILLWGVLLPMMLLLLTNLRPLRTPTYGSYLVTSRLSISRNYREPNGNHVTVTHSFLSMHSAGLVATWPTWQCPLTTHEDALPLLRYLNIYH